VISSGYWPRIDDEAPGVHVLVDDVGGTDAALSAGHDTPDAAVAWLADNGVRAKRASITRTLRRKTGDTT
jgi:hypothetical protein